MVEKNIELWWTGGVPGSNKVRSRSVRTIVSGECQAPRLSGLECSAIAVVLSLCAEATIF
jgi:hypothetical protein